MLSRNTPVEEFPKLFYIVQQHIGSVSDVEDVEEIVREAQPASFLPREHDSSNSTFTYRSFREFFLARKILAALGAG